MEKVTIIERLDSKGRTLLLEVGVGQYVIVDYQTWDVYKDGKPPYVLVEPIERKSELTIYG